MSVSLAALKNLGGKANAPTADLGILSSKKHFLTCLRATQVNLRRAVGFRQIRRRFKQFVSTKVYPN